ncbi:hypothetical protein CPB85DRAFT_1306961 [Mucidula mucida]|nr:hypothetical protein CPB85DRAFT_1306961 [Mucidula mucida]
MFRSRPVLRSIVQATQVVRHMSSTPGSSSDGDRFAVRKGIYVNGVVRIGGMMLKPGTDHDASKIEPHGSIFILEAENLESVQEMMMKDIYYTSGVWDKDAIIITPLKLAITEPLSKLQ